MPLYTFSCGSHTAERLVPLGTETAPCVCGAAARRVFGMGVAIGGSKHASEFTLTPSMRAALDEATGYKNEAIQHKQEAESNGFTLAKGR